MRSVLGGIGAAIVLAAFAAWLVPRLQEPAYEAYATSSARVGNPGENLVGRHWTGEGETRSEHGG